MTQSGALRREVLHRKKLKHPLIVPVLAAFEEEDKGRSIACLVDAFSFFMYFVLIGDPIGLQVL